MTWLVHVKGGPDLPHWEICVIHKDFAHGFRSYGWFGEQKIAIATSGGPCREVVNPLIWADLVNVARLHAHRLNYPQVTSG